MAKVFITSAATVECIGNLCSISFYLPNTLAIID